MNRVPCHQSEHKKFILLSDAMCPSKGLQILMRIVIWIVDDYGICRSYSKSDMNGTFTKIDA